MTDHDVHQRLTSKLAEERLAWRALVEEIGQDRMTEPGPMGDWSFHDLVVHLMGWRERTLDRLAAIAAGEPDPPEPWPTDLPGGDDDDPVNDWIQAQGADRSVPEVLADIDASYDRLAAALAAIPADVLTDPNGIPWLDGTAAVDVDWVSHFHVEHEPSVRAWLARRA